jgi:glycine betaine/proline transport system substrate-binding protein
MAESNVEDSHASARPLAVGHIALSFHAASAAVVHQILRDHGARTTSRSAPHEQAFDMLRSGAIDLLVSAWLPGSHGGYVAPMADDLVRLGILYEPYALWGVPAYVPIEQLRSVADLRRPEVAARATRRIQGIGAGAGISRFSREIMAAYDLAEFGYEFHNGSLQDCVAAFEAAVARQEWVVVPLWRPQFLHRSHAIRELEEPRGLLRGKDQATLLLRRDASHLVPPTALAILKTLTLGNEAVTELDHAISVGKMHPLDAARRWLSGRSK